MELRKQYMQTVPKQYHLSILRNVRYLVHPLQLRLKIAMMVVHLLFCVPFLESLEKPLITTQASSLVNNCSPILIGYLLKIHRRDPT